MLLLVVDRWRYRLDVDSVACDEELGLVLVPPTTLRIRHNYVQNSPVSIDIRGRWLSKVPPRYPVRRVLKLAEICLTQLEKKTWLRCPNLFVIYWVLWPYPLNRFKTALQRLCIFVFVFDK